MGLGSKRESRLDADRRVTAFRLDEAKVPGDRSETPDPS